MEATRGRGFLKIKVESLHDRIIEQSAKGWITAGLKMNKLFWNKKIKIQLNVRSYRNERIVYDPGVQSMIRNIG